ncbi:MAG: RCC1 domain-containing protein, partial [Acidobacteriota bacterium]
MRIVSILIILVSMIPLFSVGATESGTVQTGGTVVAWGNQVAVPTGLTDIVALKIGQCSIALKNDGSIIVLPSVGCTTISSNMPIGLTRVTAIAVDNYGQYALALKKDSSVVVWGHPSIVAKLNIPSNLINIVAIEAGSSHCLVLKRDGTVQSFNLSWIGSRDLVHAPPPGLIEVKGITIRSWNGGGYEAGHSFALKADGTVVRWGDNYTSPLDANPPVGLTVVIAIAEGERHKLALQDDGTVVALGDNSYGQTNVPSALNNVVAIAAGYYHSIALKSDGTVVAWGDNTYGQTNVPAGLTGVTAIAAGDAQSYVLMKTPIVAQPASVVTPNPTIGSGGVLTITQVLRNTLSINVTENYLASPPPGFTLIPGSCTSTIGGCVIESTPTSSQNQTGLARRSLDQSQLNSQTLTWSGVIPGNGTVTITYQIRVGTLTGGSRQ